MAKRLIFVDKEGTEMQCFLNSQNKVFISIDLPDSGGMYTGYITLDKQDVSDLIKILKVSYKYMEEII